jgi:biotin operon repressor
MSQNDKIYRMLSNDQKVTPSVARRRFGVANLRARINDLRNEGITVFTVRNGNRTAFYTFDRNDGTTVVYSR